MSDSRTLGVIGGIVATVALLIVAVVAILNQPAAEVTLGAQESTGLSVSGSGSVTVTPDVAQLDIGVEITAATVAAARDRAADSMDAIMNSLSENGVAEEDVKTRYFNIYPQYSYKEGESPEVTGFTVNNQVTVTVRDIDSSSTVLDAAIEAGGDAVRVNGITFTVDEPEQYLDEARAEAMANARDRAQTLADAAGVSVGSVRTISEASSGIPSPRVAFDGAEQAGGATSISPGEQELTISVFVVYDID